MIDDGGIRSAARRKAKKKPTVQKGISDSDLDPDKFGGLTRTRKPYYTGGWDLPTKKSKKIPHTRPQGKEWQWYNAWDYQKKNKWV